MIDKIYDLLDDGQFQNALQACNELIQQEPNFSEAFNLKGLILESLERPQEAILAYQTALEKDPKYDDARQNLAELEQELNPPQKEVNYVYLLNVAGISFIFFTLVFTLISWINSSYLTQFIPFQDTQSGLTLLRPRFNPFLKSIITSLLFFLGIALSSRMVARELGISRFRSISLIPAIGFSICFFLLNMLFPFALLPNQIVSIKQNLFSLFNLSPILILALPGAVFGGLFGFWAHESRQYRLLSAIGGAAFGIAGLFSSDLYFFAGDIVNKYRFLLSIQNLIGSSANSVMYALLFGLLGGGLGGAIFGAIQAKFGRIDITE